MAALLLSVGPVATASAQGEAVISGRVVAAADESAVASATVTLQADDRTWQTATQADGRFAFKSVVPGEFVLLVEAAGFSNREVSLTLKPREVKTLTVLLELRGVEAKVEVTGSAPSPSSTHSPSSTMLFANRLERLPTGQIQNLPEAIVAAAPGMIRGHDDFVHIRGHEVALNPMINGVSFWENPHSLFSSGISPDVIETVNVMTGGFPAEYGNRFGGVLDIVTKSGSRMQNEGSVALMVGEAGRRSVTGEFGGHRNRLGYYGFGSIAATDRFLSPPDPEAINDGALGARGFFQVDANLGQAGSLRAVLMGDGTNFDIPKHPRDLELRPQASAEQRTRQQSVIIGWTRAWSSTLAGASAYQRWSSARLSPAAGELTAIARFDRELSTLGGKVDFTRLAGTHVVKAGFEAVRLRPDEDLSYDYSGYRDLTHFLGWPHVHFAARPLEFASSETGGQLSAYVQDAIQLGDRITANVGARIDRYDLVVSATHVSPRMNVAFELGHERLLHVSYNRFFVPPPIEGVLSSSAGLTAAISEIGRALPPIHSTTEDQFEVGGSTAAGPFRLALTSYYRASESPVHTTVWPDSRIYSYASFDRARAYGVEAKAEVPRLARYGVTGYLNYALGKVDFYNPVTGGFITEAGHIDDTNRFAAPMDQRHTLSAGATYQHPGSSIWFGANVEYGSGTPMGHGDGEHSHEGDEADHDHATGGPAEISRVPSHATVNLSMGIDLLRTGTGRGRFSLQLDMENLTNDVYLIAQEGEFSPQQYSIPRILAVRVRVRF